VPGNDGPGGPADETPAPGASTSPGQ
jgi:hypothetical protein